MENKQFKKLYDVPQFKVVNVKKSHWKMWKEDEKKFVTDRNYFNGASKSWIVECEDFMLDLSTAQFSSMLESCFTIFNGKSEPEGKKFNVKTNGKQGKEIRYFINMAYDEEATRESVPRMPSDAQNCDISNEPPLPSESIPF